MYPVLVLIQTPHTYLYTHSRNCIEYIAASTNNFISSQNKHFCKKNSVLCGSRGYINILYLPAGPGALMHFHTCSATLSLLKALIGLMQEATYKLGSVHRD